MTLPKSVPVLDEMTDAQYNNMMKTGLEQAKRDDSFSVDEVFGRLERR